MLNPNTRCKTHGRKFFQMVFSLHKVAFPELLTTSKLWAWVFFILWSSSLASVMHWLSCRSHWTLTSYSFDASCVWLLLHYISQPTAGARQGRGYKWGEVPGLRNEQSHELSFIPQLQFMVHWMYVESQKNCGVWKVGFFDFSLSLQWCTLKWKQPRKLFLVSDFLFSLVSAPLSSAGVGLQGFWSIKTLKHLCSCNFSSFHTESD